MEADDRCSTPGAGGRIRNQSAYHEVARAVAAAVFTLVLMPHVFGD